VKRQGGMVLLLALIFTLLLGLLAASALREAQLSTRLTTVLKEGLQAFEQAEATLLDGLASLQRAAPGPCNGCPPPADPHALQGPWQRAEQGYFLLQNLGTTTRAAHMAWGEPVVLYRITAVSQQTTARQVVEAVYAVPSAQAPAPQRIAWRQRLKED